MDISERCNNSEHIIDITTTNGEASSSSTSQILEPPQSNNTTHLNASISRNPSFQQRRSPLNSVLWISIEFILTISQIVASIIVLYLSRHEHPRPPLRAWIVGYASGCIAILPLLYWRYCNRGVEQDSTQRSNQVIFHGPLFSLTMPNTSEVENQNVTNTRNNQNAERLRARVKALVEYFKMMLDCFFAVWFVVGNVWIFGGHASVVDAPNLYRLCIVFLTFSFIGYAMPFILCATICCCLPCIISLVGLREDIAQTRGATHEAINSLPTYKFKLKKKRNGDELESKSGGGVVAAGTDKEHVISGEDAVCCICLAKYSNNDVLRQLPCSHFFHKECVDKWLKINALCPLCKFEVGGTIPGSQSGSNIS